MAFMWLENKYTGNRNVYDIVLVEDVPYNGADKQNRQSGDAPNSKGGKEFYSNFSERNDDTISKSMLSNYAWIL